MKYIMLTLLTLISASSVCQNSMPISAKNEQPETYRAPITCTASVPAKICESVTQEFSILQRGSRVLAQVEIVIADSESFKSEKDRLSARQDRALKATANDSEAFMRLINHHPTAPSALGDSILFELDDQGIRQINKAVISSDLFRALNLKAKPTVDKDNTLHFQPGDFDTSLVDAWSKFIFGYVEGWFWGRMEQAAEQSTAGRPR